MKTRLVIATGAAVAAVAPVLLRAPKPVRLRPNGIDTIPDAVEHCRQQPLQGWDLVEYAQHLVTAKFAYFSALHLWETPALAFHNGRGYSSQYNTALAQLLEALGFRAQLVHASRVRLDDNPWWQVGHTWVQVSIDGKTLDVCASDTGNAPGRVHFVPVSHIHRFSAITYFNTNSALGIFTVLQTWQTLVLRENFPRWMYRPFDEPIDPRREPGDRATRRPRRQD